MRRQGLAMFSACAGWGDRWAGFLPPPPGTGPSLYRGPMPYTSPEWTQRPESRPPFMLAQEAIIPLEHNVPSPEVLVLSGQGRCRVHRVSSMGLFSDETPLSKNNPM